MPTKNNPEDDEQQKYGEGLSSTIELVVEGGGFSPEVTNSNSSGEPPSSVQQQQQQQQEQEQKQHSYRGEFAVNLTLHPVDAARHTLFQACCVHPLFSRFFMALSLINLATMALKYPTIEPSTISALANLETSYTVLFLVEASLLVAALGPSQYLKDRYRCIDGGVAFACALSYLFLVIPIGSWADKM